MIVSAHRGRGDGEFRGRGEGIERNPICVIVDIDPWLAFIRLPWSGGWRVERSGRWRVERSQ